MRPDQPSDLIPTKPVMKRISIYLLGFALLTQPGFAQSDSGQNAPNPTAIGMIRATLEFLATDEKSFGKVPNPVCQPCNTYEELTDFARKNRLKGADDLVNEARRQAQKAIQTNPATLASTLQTFLLDRVAGGNKSSRKQLPTFAAYQQKLNAATGAQPAPTQNVEATADVAMPTDTVSDMSDTTSLAESELETGYASTKPLSIMEYLPLLFSLVSLAGVVMLWSRGQNKREPVGPDYGGEIADLRNQISQLKKVLSQLENKSGAGTGNAQTPRPASPSYGQAQQTQTQPVQPRVPVVEPVSAPPVADVVPSVVAPVSPAPTPNTFRQTPTLLYGRTADLGDGFSSSGLSSEPDRDTVFEIRRQSDTQAVFQVSDHPDLQRLALSDPYSYLNDTCSYQTQPRPGSRIRTEKPGTLSLQGDKWAIVEKAQISFIS